MTTPTDKIKEHLEKWQGIDERVTVGPWAIFYERGVWRIYSVFNGRGWLKGELIAVPQYGKVAWPNEDGIETMGCAIKSTIDSQFIVFARNNSAVHRQVISKLVEALDHYSKIKVGDFYHRESPIGLVGMSKDVGAVARTALAVCAEMLGKDV